MKLWHFIRLRWKIVVSNRWQFLTMLLAPLFIFLGTEQLLTKGSDNLKIPVILVAEEQNETTETIIQRIKENETLHTHVKPKAEALKMLERSEAEVAVVFTKGIEEHLKKGEIKGVIHLYEAPNAIATGLIQEYVASEIIRFATNGKAATYMAKEFNVENMYEYAWNYADQQWEPKPLMTVNYETSGQPPSSVKPSKTIPPLLYGLLSIYIMLISFYHQTWVMTDRINGLSTRTGMFGANRLMRSFGNLIGALTLVVVTILPVGLYLFMESNLISNMTLISGYIFACIGISFLLANLFTGALFYYLVAIGVTFLSGVIGGSFIKISEFSVRLANASTFTPQHWLFHGLASSQSTPALTILLLTGSGMIILGLAIGAIRHD